MDSGWETDLPTRVGYRDIMWGPSNHGRPCLASFVTSSFTVRWLLRELEQNSLVQMTHKGATALQGCAG